MRKPVILRIPKLTLAKRTERYLFAYCLNAGFQDAARIRQMRTLVFAVFTWPDSHFENIERQSCPCSEQTAKATGEIGQQITGIQSVTQDSVNAIREISGTIEKRSEISSTIAAAVEEQGAATHEISRNVQQAAEGTQQVSSNITGVQQGATETGSASSQVLSAAQSLSRDSNRLKHEVGEFLNTVRAA
jgi:uncharacterized protein YoxC